MPKLLRIIALRNDDSATEKAFKFLQKHTLMTCAWSLSELKLLLQGDQYDVFLCADAYRDGTCRQAMRDVREIIPNVSVVILSRQTESQIRKELGRPGTIRVISPDLSESSLIACVTELGPPARKRPKSSTQKSKTDYGSVGMM